VVEQPQTPVWEGAAPSAPTAPHATPRPQGRPFKSTGPERFWTGKHRWIAYAAAFTLSVLIHYMVAPWSLLPKHALEFHDVDGTLTIPIDILNEGSPPPPPPPIEPPAPKVEPPDPEGMRHRDAGPPPRLDGGESDASDARQKDAERDGGIDAPSDAEPSVLDEAGVATTEDAAAPSGNARDAVGMIGVAGSVQAGPQNVVLTVNLSVIRTHPEGKRMGPLISAVPQWDDFIVGTGIEPLRDIDWISINGPALLHTEKDVIMVHYSVTDAAVDKALVVLSKKSGHGGPFDVGVPGVRAVRGYADRAERVFLRPQSHVLAVVPASYAKTAAQILSKAAVPRQLKRPAEAMRLTLVHPHGPMPGIPESVTELRLWIVPRNEDGGADVYGEGDTATPDACEAASAVLGRLIQDQNSFGVQLLTRGLLNHVEIRPDGSTVRLHLSATREQIQVVLAFVGGQLGVPLAPEPGASEGSPKPPAPLSTPR
jgi:hypothetical protein